MDGGGGWVKNVKAELGSRLNEVSQSGFPRSMVSSRRREVSVWSAMSGEKKLLHQTVVDVYWLLA